MKLSSKKATAKKMTFTPMNETALQQVKGGKFVESVKKRKTAIS